MSIKDTGIMCSDSPNSRSTKLIGTVGHSRPCKISGADKEKKKRKAKTCTAAGLCFTKADFSWMCNIKTENAPITRSQMLRRFRKLGLETWGLTRTYNLSILLYIYIIYSMPLRKSRNAVHLASILASARKKQTHHLFCQGTLRRLLAARQAKKGIMQVACHISICTY